MFTFIKNMLKKDETEEDIAVDLPISEPLSSDVGERKIAVFEYYHQMREVYQGILQKHNFAYFITGNLEELRGVLGTVDALILDDRQPFGAHLGCEQEVSTMKRSEAHERVQHIFPLVNGVYHAPEPNDPNEEVKKMPWHTKGFHSQCLDR